MNSPGEIPGSSLGDQLEEAIRLLRERFEADLPPGRPDPNYVGPKLRERSLAETRRLAELGRKMIDQYAADHPEITPPEAA